MNDNYVETQEVLERLDRCEDRLAVAERQIARAQQRQKSIGGIALVSLVGCAFFATRTPVHSQTLTLASLQAEIVALQNTLKYVTTTGTDMVISGANLHIVNGEGETSTKNGLGNLTIGYNELRNDTPSTDVRTGSHNLILGEQNSFSGYGGTIGGRHNTISGNYACVESGLDNTASGEYGCVGAGYLNSATGTYSFVGGGQGNSAAGPASTAIGGQSNTASAQAATVSGGESNTASAQASSVSGGTGNVASGTFATVGAGYGNTASGQYSFVGGGLDNAATGSGTSVTGGYANKSVASQSSILGGQSNVTNGTQSVVLGGKSNTATSQYDIEPQSTDSTLNSEIATINTAITGLMGVTKYITTGPDPNNSSNGATFITGCNVYIRDGSGSTSDNGATPTGLGNLTIGYNELSGGGNPFGDHRTGSHNFIVGNGNSYTSYGGVVLGQYNSILDIFTCVTGGQANAASYQYSSVTGGAFNQATNFAASVTAGNSNTASGECSSVTGGNRNTAIGLEASIAGGQYNSVTGNGDWGAILGGNNNTINTDYGYFPP